MEPDHGSYPTGCVVAYTRVSTDEQVVSGAGLAAQRAAIEAYADRNGLQVSLWCVDEGVSGSVPPDQRPALSEALTALSRCRSGVLLIARADRLARKTSDLLKLRDLADHGHWIISSADGSIDMSTPHGRAMATVMGAFAELERDLIRARTREALQAKKAAGVVLGRPQRLGDRVVRRIVRERAAGRSLPSIADGLTADKVATAQGGARWYPSTVAGVLKSQAAARIAG